MLKIYNMERNTTSFVLQLKKMVLVLGIFISGISFAQVQQNATLYIGQNGIVSLFDSSFNFGDSPAKTITFKTEGNNGKLYFLNTASYANATNAHHVNGYVTSVGKTIFTFPVGNDTVLAPMKISEALISDQYNVAYYDSNPIASFSNIDYTSLKAISTQEFWDVQSTGKSKVTLTWRSSSDLAGLASNISVENLTIAGWNGLQWTVIPSFFDSTYLDTAAISTLIAGSITSTNTVNFATYSKFAIAQKGICEPLIVSNGILKIWNGSAWKLENETPTDAPTLENPVQIDAAYSGISFECNSLVLNANIISGANQYVEIVNEVTGTGKIIMASSASVVQRANGVPAPTVEITKTRTDLHRLDYIYFGTPVAGNFFTAFANAQAIGGQPGALDVFYKFNSGVGGGWVSTTETIAGSGIIARVKQAIPFVNATATAAVSVVINGVANNGDIALTANNNPASPNGGTSYVLLGNPYPSAIDGDKFLQENIGLDGVLYIWKAAASADSNIGSGLYTQADYAAYTRAGGVSPAAITTNFDGNIPSGQGFKVRILPTGAAIASPTITFNNCMRVTGSNTTFYKQTIDNPTKPIDRFKVNMTGDNGVFSQILIAYMPEATLGYDRMYDAGRNSVSTAQFYSIFESDGKRLAINARPSFINTDIVPVGFKKTGTTFETFHFSLTEKEGVFNSTNQMVYIHDKIADTYHNLSTSNFSFTTNETTVNNRFEIVYQSETLSNSDFVNSNAIAFINNKVFNVQAAVIITAIQLFDLSGRLIYDNSKINQNTFRTGFYHAQGIYIAKIKLETGNIITQKLLND